MTCLHACSDMMTSSNGNIFRVTVPLCGEVPVNSPHKGQWRRALMFSLISVWIKGWVNNCEAGDLRRHHGHYDVIVMKGHHPRLLATAMKWVTKYRQKLWVAGTCYMRNGQTLMKTSSFWANFRHWLHRKLSFWHSGTASYEYFFKMTTCPFQYRVFDTESLSMPYFHDLMKCQCWPDYFLCSRPQITWYQWRYMNVMASQTTDNSTIH